MAGGRLAEAEEPPPLITIPTPYPSPNLSPQHAVQEAPLPYARQLSSPLSSLPEVSLPEPVPPVPLANSETFFADLQIIGQYRRSYLLCQDSDDLILIDQHAAHERIGFERLKKEYGAGQIERQALLFPAVIEFDFRESALVREHLDELARLGFELEPFGGRALALKSIPRLLGEADSERLLREVAAELVAFGKSGVIETAFERVLILIACHGAVRANHSLSPPEIRALLVALDQVDFKTACPHGRPVMKRLTLAEIERMFRRV